MFKNIKCVLLFILCFSLFSLKVNADILPHGTCIYNFNSVSWLGANGFSVKISQDYLGNYSYYYYAGLAPKDFITSPNDDRWTKDVKLNDRYSFKNNTSSSKYYTSCPKYVVFGETYYDPFVSSYYNDLTFTDERPKDGVFTEVSSEYKIEKTFYEKGKNSGYGSSCPSKDSIDWLTEPSDVSSSNGYCLYYGIDPDYGCYIVQINYNKNTKKVNIDSNVFDWPVSPFNKKKLFKHAKYTNAEKASASELSNAFDNTFLSTGCPSSLNMGASGITDAGGDVSRYDDFGVGISTDLTTGSFRYFSVPCTEKNGNYCSFIQNRIMIVKSEPSVIHILPGDKTIKNYQNCGEIIGTKMQDLLKNVVKVLRILIPIILNVFGVIDFARAIFAGDEEAMKKAQAKFIKRLIIGIVIYLIPSLLKLVLNIAHGIWPVVDNTVCGILD